MLVSKHLSRFVQRVLKRPSYQTRVLSPFCVDPLHRLETPFFFNRFYSSYRHDKTEHGNKSVETSTQSAEAEQSESRNTELPQKRKSKVAKSEKHEKAAINIENTSTDEIEPVKAEEQTASRYSDPKYRNIHALVLLRVIRSCFIYLDSQDFDRENIDETSRFFYIKKEISAMDFHTRKEFRVYLQEYLEFMYKKKIGGSSDAVASKVDPNIKIKTSILWYRDFSKKKVEEFLASNDLGQTLLRLIIDFLHEDNCDFQCYLGDEDEVTLGKKAKRNRKLGERTKNTLTNELTQTRESFEVMLAKKIAN